MSLKEDLIRINDALSSTLQGINSLLPFEVENLKNTPPVIEEAIGSARREGEESGYSTGYNEGRENAETIIVDISNEAIEKYTAPAEDWSELPSKIEEVYEAGKAAGGGGDDYYDTFWDSFQDNGAKNLYGYAFYYSQWNDTTFKPKYNIYGDPMNFAFCNSRITDLKGILQQQGVTLDCSASANVLSMFQSSTITRIPVLDFSAAADARNVFLACRNLQSIDKIIFTEVTGSQYNSTAMFQNCTALTDVIFAGTVCSNIDLHWSTKLSRASIESVYAALSTAAGMSANTLTLSLTAVNKAFETSEGANDGSTSAEWQNLVSGTPWRTVLS